MRDEISGNREAYSRGGLSHKRSVKPVSIHLANYFGLSKDHSPVTEYEIAHMDKVAYASIAGMCETRSM